jgi:type III secretory pathway component EscR
MGPELGLPSEVVGWILLAAAPLVLAAATAFTKVSVVLASLRVGLSAEALLPYGALLALALVVTALVMAPVGLAVAAAIELAGGIDALLAGPVDGWAPVTEPLRAFLERHADADEVEFFAGMQGIGSDHPVALVAGFLVTELTEALHMAVLILVPFVLVDLIVAQVLVLLGLAQAPMPLVTLPLKILLFLAAGGWDVVIGGLVGGYA